MDNHFLVCGRKTTLLKYILIYLINIWLESFLYNERDVPSHTGTIIVSWKLAGKGEEESEIVLVLTVRTSLCFTDQENQEENVEPTPLQVSSYTNLLYKVQDPFYAYRQSWFLRKFLILYNFNLGPVFVSQIKKLRKRIFLVEPTPLQVSSHTHLLCRVIQII